jgi:hypothetical protein
MAKDTGDPRGPGMPGSGGWFPATDVRPETTRLYDGHGDVIFDFEDVQPINGIYVEADDNLQLQILSNTADTVLLNYRVLTPNEGVKEGTLSFANGGGRGSQLFSTPLPEGFLLSAVVLPSSALSPAQYVFVSVALRFGSQLLANQTNILAQGYCSQAAPVSYPQGPLIRSTDGLGVLRSITGSVPAAGADISETVPAGARWQLLSMRATLTTAVAVASRQVKLTLDDGANRFYDTGDGPVQAASLAWAYTFAPTGSPPTNALTDVQIHYDNAQFEAPSYRVRTVTAAIQAADQWTAPQYVVREWQEMQ